MKAASRKRQRGGEQKDFFHGVLPCPALQLEKSGL
jgi:hypothetical protein